jgi:pimeloyl-ACP methyl ester carboxylesterase
MRIRTLVPIVGIAALSAITVTSCSDAPTATRQQPAPPLAAATDWVLTQLAGEGAPLTEADVRDHVSPEFLSTLMPAPALIDVMSGTVDELGALHFVRYDHPPLERSLVAIVDSDTGFHGAVHIDIDDGGLITGLDVQQAPPARPPVDDDTGWFPTDDGREMYVHCSGEGPTVVLDGGVWSDWEAVRAELAPDEGRICALDRPGAFGSASTPAPTPRTGSAHIADIRAALDAVGVAPPHVVVAHSNSGLFAQQWALEHPAELGGLVLVDPVTADYGIRRIDALTGLLPPDALADLKAQTESLPPPILDPEQLDLPGAQRLLRASWHDDVDVAAVVLTHGKPAEYPPGWPVEEDEALWRHLHRDLASRFTHGRLVVAENSGHDIHIDEPELVADAVREVLAEGGGA